MKAIVSIHDVMPDTMGEVSELIDLCNEHGVKSLTLLVVPGLEWTPDQLDQIRHWQQDGHVLAAHGWQHRCAKIRTWQHRVHSIFLSRSVAEHLSLEPEQVGQLMDRSGKWFEESGFGIPELYVPPAWALGKISTDQLRKQPFKMIETLTGVLIPAERTFIRLPVVGFEADNFGRQVALRFLNLAAISITFTSHVRIAIHPYDHRLRLHLDLVKTLRKYTEFVSYDDLTTNLDNVPQKWEISDS